MNQSDTNVELEIFLAHQKLSLNPELHWRLPNGIICRVRAGEIKLFEESKTFQSP